MRSLPHIDPPSWSARHFQSYAALTQGLQTPNATCPHCHCPVFYYASPAGHGEYFNDMGPIWARHPCADGGRLKRIIQRLQADHRKAGPAIVGPDHAHWQPFWVRAMSPTADHPPRQQLSGEVVDLSLTLYVVDAQLDPQAPFYVYQDHAQWYVKTLLGAHDWLVDRIFMAQGPLPE